LLSLISLWESSIIGGYAELLNRTQNMAQQNITHIEKVEITNLWGKYDIDWELDPKVNILIGINGSGKTTILNLMNEALNYKKSIHEMYPIFNEAKITFNGKRSVEFILGGDLYEELSKHMQKHAVVDKTDNLNKYPPIVQLEGFTLNDNGNPLEKPNFVYVSTFDMAIKDKGVVEKLSDSYVKTELDFELHQLINEFIRYQLTLGKQVEKLFLEAKDIDVKAKREEIYGKKNLFTNIVNTLFEQTGKVIDSDEHERIIFRQGETILTPYQLSSGEKQMLIILLKVLLQNNQPSILLMDEPESSLHLEWQEHLIDYILQLNEHIQIIIATHSPGIMMKGWLDKVTEIETITKVHS